MAWNIKYILANEELTHDNANKNINAPLKAILSITKTYYQAKVFKSKNLTISYDKYILYQIIW